jgi:hypothetical protein
MSNSLSMLKIYYALTPEDIEFLCCSQDELMAFTQFSSADIQKIWIELGDPQMGLHMGNKLANEYNGDIILFLASGCDPESKRLIGNKLLPSFEPIHMFKIINFFQWIKCGLGSYHLDEMFQDNSIGHLWKTSNSIYFFFQLESHQQDLLIGKYNESYS